MRLLHGFKRGAERQKSRLVISSKCLFLVALVSIAGMISISFSTSLKKHAEKKGSTGDIIFEMVKQVAADGESGQDSTSTGQHQHQHQQRQKYQFAYAFLIAGCKPEAPTYRGYIYNIAVANDILKSHNTTADVVAMIRMHIDTNHTALPPADEDILTKTGVIVKYLPRPLTDNFHTAMMDKFRILEMTEYDRIIYLDSDVLPLQSIDYIFKNSVGSNATLEENVILAYHLEPSNGGFFMLKPDKEDYQEVTKLIEKRENEGYHFNETIGWGHVITPPDYWQALKERGNLWNFYGAFTDQGLLYYWTKYKKKKVSMFFGKYLRTWNENEKGESEMVRDELSEEILKEVPQPIFIPKHRDMRLDHYPPTRDFHHFVETTKPWLDESIARNPLDHVDEPTNAYELWFNTLRKIEAEHHFDIDTSNVWVGMPTLGRFPAHSMVMWAKEAREAQSNKTKSQQP